MHGQPRTEATVVDSSIDPAVDVVYFLTHHPRTALTFISLEVAEIERLGGRVTPIAINPPDDGDLRSPEARRAHESTLYLKQQGAVALARSFMRMVVRHPVEMGRLVKLAVASSRLDLPLAARRLVHLAYACRSWEAVADRNIRHFHAHFGQTPATLAWFTARVGSFAGPEPCTWSFTIHGFQDFADERVTRLDLKVRDASFVVCISDFTRAQLFRATDPADWHRFHVVRCGIDLDRFDFRPQREHTGPLTVITVARLSAEKGHVVLLDALSDLRARGIEVELRIVGDGPMASMICDTVERLGLSDHVTLLGELLPEEVSDELRRADVFCLPSFSEGIPVSIMEAMAVGVPVVTTFVGGIPELAVDQETALVVPAGSQTALADAIAALVDDPVLRERLVSAARRAVEERHDAASNVVTLHQQFRGLPTAIRARCRHGADSAPAAPIPPPAT
jgi:colanic acid/amylovoran biosynthesis glycosyltransferase